MRHHLQDALDIVPGLHEMFRQSDIFFMANYAQTVSVIGTIKTTKTEAQLETTSHVLKLYRRHFGKIPIQVLGNVGSLDVAAAWTEDRAALTVAVVEPSSKTRSLVLTINGAAIREKPYVGKSQEKTAGLSKVPEKLATSISNRQPSIYPETG